MKRSVRRHVILAAGGLLLGCVSTLLYLREPMERLTPKTLKAAKLLWSQQGPRNYDLQYEMNGSEYDVQVRGGIVTEVLVNGVRPLSADWGNYAIDGLFSLLELEVDHLADPAGLFGGQGASVFARVRFNDRLGYPERYLRSGGHVPSATIQIRRFRAVAPDTPGG